VRDNGCLQITVKGPLHAPGGSDSGAQLFCPDIASYAASGRFISVIPAWNQPADFGSIIRASPIIMWVRDPVSRLVSTWANLIVWWRSNVGIPCPALRVQSMFVHPVAETLQLKNSTQSSLSPDVWNQLTDLDWVLRRLSEEETSTLAEKVASVLGLVPHAFLGASFYVGGLSGLEALSTNIMFVGTTETAQADMDELKRLLVRMVGLSSVPPALQGTYHLAHTRGTDSGRTKLTLSRDAVAFARLLYADDYRVIEWLSQHGLLYYGGDGATYPAAITSEDKLYPYEPPIGKPPKNAIDAESCQQHQP